MPASPATALSFLLGSFTGVEEMSASPWAPAGSARSTVVGVGEIGGTHLVQRYAQQRDGATSFELLAVWMIDPADGATLHYGFDTAGFPPDPPARGGWAQGRLVLDRTTARGSSRLVVTPTEPGWEWAKAFRAPGADDWTPVLHARFTPVPAR